MRFGAITGLISLLLCVHAVADEPTESFVAKKHVLGRVFMSDAERRQLDVLRKTRGTVENSGNVSSTVAAAQAEAKKMTKPTGYIVPSNGSPYQWIDGDFRRVVNVEINSADISQEIQITRVENDDDSSKKRAPEVEIDDENRAPQ